MPDLEEHYADLRAVVAEFADEVVAPVAVEHDREHSFPYEVVAQMGAMGLFGLPFSEEYGGMGSDFFALALALEELGRVDQSVAITLEAAVGLGAMPIYRFGTDDQKARWLPDLLSGRALAGFGLTEAGAGTDAAALRTTAARDADEWVINGAKQFITNSGTDITSLVLVAAATGPAADGLRASRSGADRYADRAAIGSERTAGNREISTLIVPAGTPGFTVEPAYDKVGWRASDTHPLNFAGARVPTDHLLGERGRGYANFLATLDEGRIALAALATGAAQGCVNESVKYARQRESFGRPLGAFQAVSFKVARMEARAHAARCAYHDAARLLLAGKPFKQQAAIAKLVASEAAMDNARDATQIHGGYGFMNEYPVARHYRDSKVLEIGEGTSEVQLMVIARELGL